LNVTHLSGHGSVDAVQRPERGEFRHRHSGVNSPHCSRRAVSLAIRSSPYAVACLTNTAGARCSGRPCCMRADRARVSGCLRPVQRQP
jgi:hypothetical protein